MPPEGQEMKTPTEDEIRGMGEDELMKLTGQAPVDPPTGQQDPPPAPAAAAEGAAPGDTGKEGTPAAGTPAAEGKTDGSPAAPTGKEEPAPAAAETTYAGKYKSPEELVKGFNELGEKLGGFYAEHAKRLVEAGLAAKSYKDIEAAYALYEKDLGKRSAPPAAPPAAPAAPAKPDAAAAGDPAQLSEAESRQIQETVKGVYTQRLAAHPVMVRFAQAGKQVPRNREELNALAQEDFVLAQSYMDALTEVRESVASEFAEIGTLKSSLPALQQTAVTEATAALKAFSEKTNLKLTDEQIAAVVTEGMASGDPLVFETKHGFKVPRTGGLLRWFKAEKLDGYIEQVRIASESEGRKKHADDLEKMKSQARGSIGNTAIPHRQQKAPEAGKVDLKDPDQVRMMTEEQLLNSLK